MTSEHWRTFPGSCDSIAPPRPPWLKRVARVPASFAGIVLGLAICVDKPANAQSCDDCPLDPTCDPTLSGAYGSNNRGQVAGWVDEPWSYWMNPAHPGVREYFGLPVPNPANPDEASGLGLQSYGETTIDGYPLVDWSLLSLNPPVACWQSPGDSQLSVPGWSVKTWTVNGHEYRRKTITLESGAALFVFRPFLGNAPETAIPPGAPADYSDSYDADALFYILNYQGSPYGLTRSPSIWLAPSSYPYDPSPHPYLGSPLFGMEIETAANAFKDVAGTSWIRQGSVEHEALERGMTLVFVMVSLGLRPVLASQAQLVEAGMWLDSADYQSPSLRHRKVLMGGSIGGILTIMAVRYMPWLFRGGVSIAGFNDFHAAWDWMTAHVYLQQQLIGNYQGGHTYTTELESGEFGQLIDLRRGYIPDIATPGFESIAGVPLDYAGMSLFASQITNPLSAPDLVVPIVLAHGDEDPSQYKFLSVELNTLPCGTLQPNAPNPDPTYVGKIIDMRCPVFGHGDTGAWDAWNADIHLLEKLMDELNAQPTAPIPSALFNPIGYKTEAGPDDPQIGDTFRKAFLEPALTATDLSYVAGVSVQHVETPSWQALRVHAGLGASGKIWVADVDGDSRVEIVADENSGELVKLRLVPDPLSASGVRLETAGSVRISNYYGPSEVVPVPASPGHAVVAHFFGPIRRVDCSNPSGEPVIVATGSNEPQSGDYSPLGWYMRDLRKLTTGNAFAVSNDEGENITLGGGSLNVLAKSFVEGRRGPVINDGVGQSVYVSPHGNVKRAITIAGIGLAHPNAVDDMSPHLFAQFVHLLAIPSGPVAYLAAAPEQVVLLDADLNIVDPTPPAMRPPDAANEANADAVFHGLESPDGLLLAGVEAETDRIRLYGYNFGADAPVDKDAHVGSEIRVLEVDPNDPTQSVSILRFVKVPGPVTALAECPSGLSATFADAQSRAVTLVATLQSGQVALLADLLSGGNGDLSSSHVVVLGEAFGNSFGFVRGDAQGTLIAAGPQGKCWQLLATSDAAPLLPGTLPNEAPGGGTGSEVTYPPYRGAVRIAGKMYGLPDGGASFGSTSGSDALVATAFAYDRSDPHKSKAGVRVIDMETWAAHANPQNFDALPNQWFWHSPPNPEESLISTRGVGKATSTPFILHEFGNSCVWADLDREGSPRIRDLVAGTHGGRVLWWKNNALSDQDPPVLDDTFTGEYSLGDIPATHAMKHGWKGDLGSQIIGMAVGDLDDDGDDEVIAGLGLAVDWRPENFKTAGSIVVLDRSATDQLVKMDCIALPFGCYGVSHFEVDTNGVNDDYILVGTAGGRVFLFHYDHLRTQRLIGILETKYLAPMIGAYNSILDFDNGTASTKRIVLGSSWGLYALDLDLPRPFPPL